MTQDTQEEGEYRYGYLIGENGDSSDGGESDEVPENDPPPRPPGPPPRPPAPPPEPPGLTPP